MDKACRLPWCFDKGGGAVEKPAGVTPIRHKRIKGGS